MDESGLLMGPLVRRSWALRGQPPVLKQKARHREKVSVAAALWLTPLRDRLGLAFQTLVNGYFNNGRRSIASQAAWSAEVEGRSDGAGCPSRWAW